jgi:hypothetical protein
MFYREFFGSNKSVHNFDNYTIIHLFWATNIERETEGKIVVKSQNPGVPRVVRIQERMATFGRI